MNSICFLIIQWRVKSGECEVEIPIKHPSGVNLREQSERARCQDWVSGGYFPWLGRAEQEVTIGSKAHWTEMRKKRLYLESGKPGEFSIAEGRAQVTEYI